MIQDRLVINKRKMQAILNKNACIFNFCIENRLIDNGLIENKNIVQITGGGDAFFAIDSEGRVYGTGSNIYGLLGRWKGSDRTSPNSRYRTAFEWVECPELEI